MKFISLFGIVGLLLTTTFLPTHAQPTGAPFPSPFPLDALDGTNGFIIEQEGLDFGRSGAVGDVNGDGRPDLFFGEYSVFDPEDVVNRLIFGRPDWPALSVADSLPEPTTVRFQNGNALGNVPHNVSVVGDLNGDGFDELCGSALPLIISPPASAQGNNFVVYGRAQFDTTVVNLATLDSTEGFVVRGLPAGNRATVVVGAAGDLDGDGFDDLIAGQRQIAYQGDSLRALHILWGRAAPFPPVLADTMLTPQNSTVLIAERFNATSPAGDVNGDGREDLLVGTAYGSFETAQAAGRGHVLFGSAQRPDTIDLRDLSAGQGLTLEGVPLPEQLGVAVAGGGDLNGDGFDDVAVVQAAEDAEADTLRGVVYVVFGGSTLPPVVDVATLDGTDGFVYRNLPERILPFGNGPVVDIVGDMTGDGRDELVVGSAQRPLGPNAPEYAGGASVIFGRATFPAEVTPQDLDGSNGFNVVATQTPGSLGWAVGAAGDQNGDGLADVFITDPTFNVRRVYVIYGRLVTSLPDATAAAFPLAAYPNPTAGTLRVRVGAERPALALFDVLGRRQPVRFARTDAGTYRADLSALPAGMYYLRATAGGQTVTRPVAKQ